MMGYILLSYLSAENMTKSECKALEAEPDKLLWVKVVAHWMIEPIYFPKQYFWTHLVFKLLENTITLQLIFLV